MDFLVWIVFGAIAGYIASIVMKNNRRQGTVEDIIVGIIGAFIGGLIMNSTGQPGVTGFNLYSFFVAVVGAMVLIFALRRLRH